MKTVRFQPLKFLLGISIFVFALTGCNEAHVVKESLTEIDADKVMEYEPMAIKKNSVGSGNQEESIRDRKLIQRGDIEFETTNLLKTKNSILDKVKKYKGYCSEDNENVSYHRKTGYLKIRVPSESFHQLLNDISGEAGKLDHKKIEVEDVTEEFLDAKVRIRNKKELESRYLELLKKAGTVKQMLEIEKEIGSLREEIELIEGRHKYLKNQVAYSTLQVAFYVKLNKSNEEGNELLSNLKAGWEGLYRFLMFLVKLWPLLIAVAIAGMGYKKFRSPNKSDKQ